MDGASERVIGDHLAKRPGPRDPLVIATKYALTMDPDDPNNGGTGRKALRRHVEESLTRLRTDYLDLYWQHRMFVGRHLGERTWTLLDTLGRLAAAHGTTVAAASLPGSGSSRWSPPPSSERAPSPSRPRAWPRWRSC
jgi:aryl-alcohol dehydrogenase-like predicted oxidoreductase